MTGHAILKALEILNRRISAAAIRFPVAQHDAQNGRLWHAKSGNAINLQRNDQFWIFKAGIDRFLRGFVPFPRFSRY